MSDIAPAAGAAAIRSAQDGGPGGGDAAPTVSEPTNQLTADFETFLRLLTTQLRNQDPLAPIESTEFVAQLAAFSSVGVVFGNMLQSTRGLISVGLAVLLLRLGVSGADRPSGRGQLIQRACGAALMTAAIVLYYTLL